ncbi:FecCD family ABC transporter permease [Pseudophaeobacter sp.]|uniref:FecCD family ABC transporter permease n=1 Tax=Pseudophaeobacter sp. TaxID=1971739 RepID=UPI00405959F9
MTLASLLAALFLALGLLHLQQGPAPLLLTDLLTLLWQDDGSKTALILHQIRLPRTMIAALAGAALAGSGVLIQVVTRNPLGDPGLTGVSAGATFGVAVMVVLGMTAAWAVVGVGILGGACAGTMTFVLTRRVGMQDIHLLLAGLTVAVFFTAATSTIMMVERTSLQSLYFWMIGGFANKGWAEFALLWPICTVSFALTVLCARFVELLQIEDSLSRGLGLNTGLWRLFTAALSVGLAAGAVAVAGPIAFVGFVTAHIIRLLLSPARGRAPVRTVFCLSALAGGSMTLGADIVSRSLAPEFHVPAGAVAAVIGGVVFLIVARNQPQSIQI